MLQRHGTIFRLALALAASVSALACSDADDTPSASSSGSTNVVTSIAVEPSRFLGDVPCAMLPGAMRSYVATLTDRTDRFPLPSSPPTSCTQDAVFRYILAGHLYSAIIDGYEQDPSELLPLGGDLSGSRHMRLAAGGTALVTPRWMTECGKIDEQATLAVAYSREPIRNCDPLASQIPASGTAIVLDPGAPLGGLGCTASGGQVANLDISPLDSALAGFVSIPCGTPAVTYTSGLAPGSLYTFYVEARAVSGGPIVWGALCFATAQEGLTVHAACDALADTGAITADPGPLFASKGYDCPADIATYQATLGPMQAGIIPCQDPVRFDLVAPGDVQIMLQAPITGGGLLQASCSGTVQPGRTISAVCSAP